MQQSEPALTERATPEADRMPAPIDSSSDRGVQGELRHLTAVFCDVVGSTDLSTRLDPEELGEITARYHEEVVKVVERYGGEVVRYLGDGVLIEFGWPVAHDDDCERAVRTAIEVAAAVEAVNAELPAEVTLAARIGVHTGQVLVGELGGGAYRQRMALGETMNIAARIQEAAAPGTAVISETTRRLVRGIFVTEELDAQSFKGVPDPLRVHLVIQPAGVPSRFDDAGGMLSPYVGRDGDLDSLLAIPSVRRIRNMDAVHLQRPRGGVHEHTDRALTPRNRQRLIHVLKRDPRRDHHQRSSTRILAGRVAAHSGSAHMCQPHQLERVTPQGQGLSSELL